MDPTTALAVRAVMLLSPMVALALLPLIAWVATWRLRRDQGADQ